MEVEAARRDASALDPELLQLPELAPGALRENSSIAEALYLQWLVLPESSKLVTSHPSSCPRVLLWICSYIGAVRPLILRG